MGRVIFTLILVSGAAVMADRMLACPIGLQEILGALFSGWITSVVRFAQEKQVCVPGLVRATVSLIGLFLGSHFFLRWLIRAMLPTDAESACVRTWYWRNTAATVGLVLLVFTAGVAAIGVVHQTSWLVASSFTRARP